MPKGDGGKKTRFKKGNPIRGGRPKLDPEVKELRMMNRQEVERLVNSYWMLDEKTIEKKLTDRTLPARDKMVLRMVRTASKSGSESSLKFFTDFIFGEQAKKFKFDGNMTQMVANVPPAELDAAMKKLEDEF